MKRNKDVENEIQKIKQEHQTKLSKMALKHRQELVEIKVIHCLCEIKKFRNITSKNVNKSKLNIILLWTKQNLMEPISSRNLKRMKQIVREKMKRKRKINRIVC